MVALVGHLSREPGLNLLPRIRTTEETGDPCVRPQFKRESKIVLAPVAKAEPLGREEITR